jgi:hypothetical protein
VRVIATSVLLPHRSSSSGRNEHNIGQAKLWCVCARRSKCFLSVGTFPIHRAINIVAILRKQTKILTNVHPPRLSFPMKMNGVLFYQEGRGWLLKTTMICCCGRNLIFSSSVDD